MSLNVRPNITFARIWNLIKHARDYDPWPESIYHFPGTFQGTYDYDNGKSEYQRKKAILTDNTKRFRTYTIYPLVHI